MGGNKKKFITRENFEANNNSVDVRQKEDIKSIRCLPCSLLPVRLLYEIFSRFSPISKKCDIP
jgi:hypothetical protein